MMTHEVVVDTEVYKALQERAEPFVDSPNTVLRRLLGLGESLEKTARTSQRGNVNGATRYTDRSSKSNTAKGGKRAPKGALLPEAEYELPILQALAEAGGRAATSELLERLGPKIQPSLQPADKERIVSGSVRWKNRAQFVRLNLVRSGDMVKGSPRGIWEISDQGKQRLVEATGSIAVTPKEDRRGRS
jgi:hypothetical protein